MRYLIISDLHSNIEALDSFFNFIERKKFQKIIILGDLVGYGGNPNEVIERVRGEKKVEFLIRGNHDRAAVIEGAENTFNLPAMVAVLWTRQVLKGENFEFLKKLEKGPLKIENFLICHGSPIDEDLYILSEYEAYQSFINTKENLVFFGHSHIPCVFTFQKNKISGFLLKGDYFHLKLNKNVRYLINPGSIGQPRDGNPKPSFLVYDSKSHSITFYRYSYDIKKAQRAIINAGLPIHLASRLERGL